MAADTYETGFCNVGSHEGTKPLSYSGRPLPTCTHYMICTCSCHAQITRMFELTGRPRSSQQNPDYMPDVLTAWMPSLADRVASSTARASVPVTRIESPAPALVPVTLARTFTPTPTGRLAPGELEQLVKRAVDGWLVDWPDVQCTVGWIGASIAEASSIPAPSPGAIQAVLERWVKIGFASMGKKPVRFTGYTVDGIQHGLDALKLREKQNKGRKLAAANRGERHG